MKLNQFAFLRAFCRWFSLQIEPPAECFFNTMENEIWLDSECVWYKVSNLWMVMNKKGVVMGVWKNKKGYRHCSLCPNGENKNKRISNLVALAFVENDDVLRKTQVNHIDWNKDNDCAINLEWTTPSENVRHAWRLWLCKVREWNNFVMRQKSVMQLTKEGILCRIYKNMMEAERITWVGTWSISSCCRGKTLFGGWYKWQYVI